MARKGAVVAQVEAASLGDELGIEPGDRILTINNREIEDLIDYNFQIADQDLEIELEKASGEVWVLEVEKDWDEDLGISFRDNTFDGIRACKNKCIFCFVDQMPPDMRQSLYVKDDDYRMSFLHGNFITMSNVAEEELQRIIAMNLSPLYISIHTTNPELRVSMLKNPKAGEVLDRLRRLVEAGIELHGQIVLVPGVNDSEELERTLMDLHKLYPGLQSLAVVPVGLTKYRDRLENLRQFSASEAGEVIRMIDKFRGLQLEKGENPLFYSADEFYVLSKQQVPSLDYYADFPQTENGVGLIRLFLEEFKEIEGELPKQIPSLRLTWVTGVSAADYLNEIAKRLVNKIKGLSIEVRTITNHYFGSTVTVSGLVTAKDILDELQNQDLGEYLMLPSVMLKKGEEMFLDGVTLEEFSNLLGVETIVLDDNNYGDDFLRFILRWSNNE